MGYKSIAYKEWTTPFDARYLGEPQPNTWSSYLCAIPSLVVAAFERELQWQVGSNVLTPTDAFCVVTSMNVVDACRPTISFPLLYRLITEPALMDRLPFPESFNTLKRRVV